MSRFSTRPTPNPNSLMIVFTDGRRFLDSGLRSYKNLEQAAADPLAIGLFTLPGVTELLIMPDFLTVTRAPGTAWDVLLPQVEAVLDAHYGN